MRHKTANRKRSVSAAAILIAAALVCSLLFLLYFHSAEKKTGQRVVPVDPNIAVITVLDVGQGDCIVIQAGGKVAMIDAGDNSDYSKRTVASFLDENEITRIDYLFATHPHTDHIGGMRDVILRVEIGEVVFSEIEDKLLPTTNTYIQLLKTIDERDLTLRIARKYERYMLGLGELTVVSAGGYGSLNNCSLVMIYRYGNTAFLFAGDAEKPVERDILETGLIISCDVLKVGHHGSSTSSSEEFLSAVSPRFAVISCKADNQYGHPDQEVLGLLDERGVSVLRTDVSGTVTFESDAKRVTALFEQGKAA